MVFIHNRNSLLSGGQADGSPPARRIEAVGEPYGGGGQRLSVLWAFKIQTARKND